MNVLIQIVGTLLGRLPMGVASALGRGLGALIGSGLRYRGTEVAEAMARGLPGTTEKERRRFASHMYRHLGQNLAENLRLAYGNPEPLLDSVSAEGLSEVDAILAHGKGVLILSGHVGNWELFGFKARRMGYPVHVIVKEIKGRAVDDMTVRLRERFDIGLIPRQNSYRSCVRALRDNAMIAFMLDQNMIRDEGVFVDFFDRPACTSAGLAHLSALSGIPVVPVFCFREADGSHRFRAYPAIDPPAGRDEETIREATQAYTRRIEDAIREHPDQWIWIHRRWRTRPLAYADAEPQGPAPAAVPQGD